jgi:hypothetical protein
MLSFAQTGLDFRRPTTDLDPGLVRLINLDTRLVLQQQCQIASDLFLSDPEYHGMSLIDKWAIPRSHCLAHPMRE